MEILSDATFKGNVTFNKLVTINNSEIITGSLLPDANATIRGELGVDSGFSFVPVGEPCSPILKISSYNNGLKSVSVGSDATFESNVIINNGLYIGNGITEFSVEQGSTTVFGKLCFNGSTGISSWTELHNILHFAPSSLSTDVDCLSTTVSSNTTKINSLLTTVAKISSNKSFYTSFTLPNAIDASCGKFTIGLENCRGGSYDPNVGITASSLEGNGYDAFRINNRNIQKIRVTDPNTNKDLLIDVYGCTDTSTEFIVEKSTNYELPAGTRFTIYYTID